MTKYKWNLLSTQESSNIEQIGQVLLKNRNVDNDPYYFHVKNPLEMTYDDLKIDKNQFSTALKRIEKAIKNKEKVLIFGDYDADGICATAVIWESLYALGLNARPFIPHRKKHGYGLSDRALDELLHEDKPDLIITVDNGIVAHQPLNRLQEEGVDVIVTDHHQPDEKFPPAFAIVHSTLACGAGVAWVLAKELDLESAKKSLDLVGIATISDLMPLIGVNRSFAKHGLMAIGEGKRPGLMALLMEASLDKKSVSSSTVGFGIGPRINAMGRLEHGLDALRLLITKNQKKAFELAKVLDSTNTKRQDLTSDLYDLIKKNSDVWKDEKLIFFASEEVHEGVMGLIAGRLVEKYAKPAIVISIGEKTSKASARSIKNVNIVELMRLVKDDLLEVGGHPMAGGFVVDSTKIEIIRQKLLAQAEAIITDDQLVLGLDVDLKLTSNLIGLELIDLIEKMEPFGQMNPPPLFEINSLEVLSTFLMGAKKQHLKITVKHPDSSSNLTCIFWNGSSQAEQLKKGDIINVVASLELNKWNGYSNIQLMVKDIELLAK